MSLKYQFDFDIEKYQISEEEKKLIETWCEKTINYYTDGSSDFSDSEFDDFENELFETLLNEELVNQLKSCIYRNGKFVISHQQTELISLHKIKFQDNKFALSHQEIKVWFNNFVNEFNQQSNQDKISLGTDSLLIAPKFDGCSLKITWDLKNSVIQSIHTRGGLDVTEIFKSNQDILSTKKYKCKIICGELIISRERFEIYSDEYKNPRNFVSSLTKRKNLSQTVIDDLSFFAYSDGVNPLGEYWQTYQNNEVEFYQNLSNNFNYECDGIVIAYNGYLQTRLVKNNYPLNMVACKFPSPKIISKVVDIEWTQKKTGNLIPTVVFEPKELCGSVIRRAAGFNWENIQTNGIGIGSIIEVTKSGDIIPYITKVIKKSKDFVMPTTKYKISGKNLIAEDDTETIKFKFINGIKLLQIQGIGEQTALELGEIFNYNILEIFNKELAPDVINKIGTGAAWNNFKKVYEDIKQIPLNTLIELLQFNAVGPKIAYKIAMIILLKSNDKSNIPDSVLTLFSRSGNGINIVSNAIQKLSTFGVNVIKPIEINDDVLTYEMSGKPENMSKQQFEQQVKSLVPNAIHATLTKETKILFVDSLTSNSSKINKARKYNIKIQTYSDFIKNGLLKD